MERYSANDRVVFIDRTRDSKLSDFSKATLDDRYLLKGESYQDLFARVACAYSDDDAHAQRIYDYMSKLWFLGATPVLSNGGAGRGLPISCFLNQASDSLKGIVDLWNENVWLASNGGGIGSYWGDLRSIGENVAKAGKTSGIIPFIKVMDSMTLAISQGSLRRGSAAVYLDIGHPEIEEFLEIRKPTGGDPNRKALNLNHAVMIPDAFMRALEVDGEWELKSPHNGAVTKVVRARDLWHKILTLRIETGEPYIVFADRANEAMPEHHKKSGLKIKTSNLCFSGDTMVAVADGRNAVSIKELAERDDRFPVYSARFVSERWDAEVKNATAFKTGTRELVTIDLDNGDKFRCTPDHQLAVNDGSYIAASESLGKVLESLDGLGLKVVAIESGETEDVYDLTVDDNHNFYIITSDFQGVLVHNCSEILLPTGIDHHGKNRTAVCCLSSLNLETYEEWENDDYIIEDVLRFLDNVLQDFIDRAPPGMESAKYSAMMERSVGLGVMGWHSFLQKRMIPMESVMAKVWNNRIFSRFKHKCDEANEKLAIQKGACPDAAEYGVMRRFSNCSAIAPTASISIIASNSSPGIEPYAANAFTHKTLTGSFPVRNKYLVALLKEKGMDTQEVWSSIITNLGSVQHLDFLSDLEKDVFKTAFEIDQRWIIDLAADRTPFIDQSQSLNLFLPADVDKKVLNFLHFLAWKKGIKSLYYCRSRSLKRSEVVSSKVVRERLPEVKEVALDECLSCQ